MRARIAALLVPFLLATPALATDWPSFQAGLKTGRSNAPEAAALPGDVKITPPGKSVPPALAKFSGSWSGWMCRNRVCDVKIAVEKVDASGATFVYAFSDQKLGTYATRIKGQVNGDEISGPDKVKGGTVTIRLRPDGAMDVLRTNPPHWASGILARN